MRCNYFFKHWYKQIRLSAVIVLFFSIFNAEAQHWDIDYTTRLQKENIFKTRLFKQAIVGVNTLQHIDASVEVLNIKYLNKNGVDLAFSLFGTQGIWIGNKNDQLNLLSYMHNPIGGMLNGSLIGKFRLHSNDKELFKVALRFGQRLIEGIPKDPLSSRFFIDNFGSLGFTYQRLLYENDRENKSLYMVFYPSGIVHNSNAGKRELFFKSQLKTTLYGYGFQLGFELNKTFRISLMGHQLLNAEEDPTLEKFVFRFSTGYVF